MASDPTVTRSDRHPTESEAASDPLVLLFMDAGRDRDLLSDTLSEHYRITTTTDSEALETPFDCCILNDTRFGQVGDMIQSIRDRTDRFLPFVLLVGPDSSHASNPEVWTYVDDVIELPVAKEALTTRIRNLIERRQTSVQLAEREAQLRATVEDLRLKERAIDEAPVGMTISGPADEDTPLVYVNDEFEALTGYQGSDILGRNCRFLQGEDTDPETRAEIREAIENERPVAIDILNYRRSGESFWNRLEIAPIRNESGTVTNYVGFQTDITERKLREQRLAVLNRVLSHNLRNKMNVIEGHTDILRAELDDDDPPPSIQAIDDAAANLGSLAETVRDIERIMSTPETPDHPNPLADRLQQLASGLRDQFPDATIELSLPADDPCNVAVGGLMIAIEEAAENAIRHNNTPDAILDIRVRPGSDSWIEIELEDNGPGIPEQELAVLTEGETPLQHADRLGLWLIYWVTSRAGGKLTITEGTRGGTLVRIAVPGVRQEDEPGE